MRFIVFIVVLASLSSCSFLAKKRQLPYANDDIAFTDLELGDISPDSVSEGTLSWLDKLPMPESIQLQDEPTEAKDKKKTKAKKPKKNEFFGLKTKRGYAKRGIGSDQIIESFRFISELPGPEDPYIRDYYWYDIERREVSRNRDISNKKGYVLHGQYQRFIGGDLVEEGLFYKGVKQGRWIQYARNGHLVNKQYFHRGWPVESEVVWYDAAKNRIRAITPIEYGEKEGNFFAFHDNGQIAVSGQYRFNERVGIWTEYYRQQRRPKREIQYAPEPFNSDFRPYVVREWDDRGNVVYERR
jgi:antitoxin component YwqK of YwqJK toxin-antitoxin module